MVGFLNLMLGGALKGAGDAMVDKAKADREAAIAALAEQNKRADMQTQEGYETQNIGQQGDIQKGIEQSREASETNLANINNQAALDRTNLQEAGANTRTAETESGANTRSAAEIAGRHEDVSTQTATQEKVADIRAKGMTDRAQIYADRISGGKQLTPGQALLAARSAYKDAYAAGETQDADGNQIPAKDWIQGETDRLMQEYGPKSGSNAQDLTGLDNSGLTGGGLTAPYGGQSQPVSMPQQQAPVQQAPVQQAPVQQAPMPQQAPVQQTQVAPTQGATTLSGVPQGAPPIGAVDMLQKNPSLAPFFDQKYGQGASAAALGK